MHISLCFSLSFFPMFFLFPSLFLYISLSLRISFLCAWVCISLSLSLSFSLCVCISPSISLYLSYANPNPLAEDPIWIRVHSRSGMQGNLKIRTSSCSATQSNRATSTRICYISCEYLFSLYRYLFILLVILSIYCINDDLLNLI